MIQACRANKYQWKINEIPFDYNSLIKYNNSHSLNYLIDPYIYKEQMFILQDQLLERVMLLAEQYLTDKQFKFIKLYYIDNLTQVEIAKIMNVIQNTVSKSIIGVKDSQGGKMKRYGALNKLRQIVMKDQRIINILQEMDDLKEEKY